MGKLTTHVLDTANGRPASGVRIRLYAVGDDDLGARRFLCETTTNADGRCDAPLLDGEGFKAGRYEIVFGAGAYFAALGTELPQPAFVGDVVLRFGIADGAQHYHVPLLVSPWSWSTYRGS
ncbi:MAG: hydroxyisourate hydrolase [Casimicrobiaceae bacterium]